MKLKNRSKTIFGLFIISLLFLTACSNNQPNQNQTDCNNLNGAAKENCLYESKNCNAMQESDFKNSCTVELARDQNNTAICDTLTTEKSKGYCYEELAIKNQDKELCSKINDAYWKDNCYYNLGVSENKEGLCYLIQPTNVEQKADCFMKVALSKRKVEVCDYLPTEPREACIFQVAIKTQNTQTCNQVQDQFATASCIYRIAKETNNQELCNQIKIKDAREICIKHFENTNTATQ